MGFQPDPEAIVWRMHLASSPDEVYTVLDSDEGRASFWAESAEERDGHVNFVFSSGLERAERITERVPGERWGIEYFGSLVTFALVPDGAGGTDLTLMDRGVADADRAEVTAGWLNVLLPLKAAVDYDIDLRNHHRDRTWREGYVDG